MSKVRYSVRIERWTTSTGQTTKIAVRDQYGRFHGATNFARAATKGR